MPNKRVTVILRRGTIGTRQWTHKTPLEAFRRAQALADLHMVSMELRDDAYVIDASDYYSKVNK